MGRVTAIALAVLLLAAPLALPAGAARPEAFRGRVASQNYVVGEGGVVVLSNWFGVTSVAFPGGPENAVSLRVEDASGVPVYAEVLQGQESLDILCGRTDEPVPIDRNEPIFVVLYSGSCLDGTPSSPTSGVVTAKFEKRPFPQSYTKLYSATGQRQQFGFDQDPSQPGVFVTGVDFQTGPNGRTSIAIEDVSGTEIQGVVYDRDKKVAEFCTSIRQPLRLKPHSSYGLDLYTGSCPGKGAGATTRGKISFSFGR